MHVVVLPSWYPKSETDVDGIFFRLQAQALQRKGLKVGVIAPLFRSLRTEWKSILTGPYGMRHHQQGGLNIYVYRLVCRGWRLGRSYLSRYHYQ